MLWKDAMAPPFRFNPKLSKEEQGKPMFISVKAKFLPRRNVFGFDSLIELPTQDPPRFLKLKRQQPPSSSRSQKPPSHNKHKPKIDKPNIDKPKIDKPKIKKEGSKDVA